jgi:hypothetical protein
MKHNNRSQREPRTQSDYNPDEMSVEKYHYHFTEDGIRLYECLTCLDTGWVHLRKGDGKTDYSKVKRCPNCHPGRPLEDQQASLLPEVNT